MLATDYALWIGSGGVMLLLIAFALNLLNKLSEQSRIYLNVLGSLAAGWYAYVGDIFPFLILELVWAAVALARLLAVTKKNLR